LDSREFRLSEHQRFSIALEAISGLHPEQPDHAARLLDRRSSLAIAAGSKPSDHRKSHEELLAAPAKLLTQLYRELNITADPQSHVFRLVQRQQSTIMLEEQFDIELMKQANSIHLEIVSPSNKAWCRCFDDETVYYS
jgi:hypothetical protein